MNVFLDSVGCRLNQSEIERLGAQFRLAGHTLVGSVDHADLIIINTCAVTQKAAADSRALVRRVARDSKSQIIVTGCWATMEPDTAASMSSVVEVVDNINKDTLPHRFGGIRSQSPGPISPRMSLPGDRSRTRAFIKCQDGCNRACTYCVTRVARGKSRSQTIDTVVTDITAAVNGGVKEVVLTGVQLGAWGMDLPGDMNLIHLVAAILDQTQIPRIRFSSIEPWDLSGEFFSLFKEPRICRHLHLPLQSGCSETLERMARKTTLDQYLHYIESARLVAPEIAITTDVIVGFPGESDRDFAASLSFVERIGFAQGHVFPFSPRQGTPAAQYPDQVDAAEKKRRSREMRRLFEQSAASYRSTFIGQVGSVLWETRDKTIGGWFLEGLTDNYLRVSASAGQDRWNYIDQVRLLSLEHGKYLGDIL